jgi:hypothetical protein
MSQRRELGKEMIGKFETAIAVLKATYPAHDLTDFYTLFNE